MKVPNELKKIAAVITKCGGKPYIVGGSVRDHYMGIVGSKDFDFEVFGINYNDLANVLEGCGKVDVVGKSFGVIKLTTSSGQSYDFSLPRKESRTGVGHTDFMVQFDPDITTFEAASRRDFTINSLMYDINEDQLVDHFNGLEDIREGVLLSTSISFEEDALRVLRGFQFCGRFGLESSWITESKSDNIRDDYQYISKERVFDEWFKWATLSTMPSKGLAFLKRANWLSLYPELNALVGVNQDPLHHPEGDAWQHTEHVVDAAAKIATREHLSKDETFILVMAALCHDLGKATTTEWDKEKLKWTSYGHDKAGEAPTRSFLESIGCHQKYVEHIVSLVVNHMAHVFIKEGALTNRIVLRLAKRLHPSNIDMFALLAEADHSGRPPKPPHCPPMVWEIKYKATMLDLLFDKPKPIIGGKDLLSIGFLAGKRMGEIIGAANLWYLDGEVSSKEEAIERVLNEFGDEIVTKN